MQNDLRPDSVSAIAMLSIDAALTADPVLWLVGRVVCIQYGKAMMACTSSSVEGMRAACWCGCWLPIVHAD